MNYRSIISAMASGGVSLIYSGDAEHAARQENFQNDHEVAHYGSNLNKFLLLMKSGGISLFYPKPENQHD